MKIFPLLFSILSVFMIKPSMANVDLGCHFEARVYELMASVKSTFPGEYRIGARNLIDTLEQVDYYDRDCHLATSYLYYGYSFHTKNKEQGIEYLDIGLEIAKNCYDGESTYYAIINTKAILFILNNDVDSAISYFEEAYNFSKFKNKKHDWFLVNLNLARVYLSSGNSDKFLKHLNQAKTDAFERGDSSSISQSYEMFAQYYKTRDIERAAVNFDLCIKWSLKKNTANFDYLIEQVILFYKEHNNHEKVAYYYETLFDVKKFDEVNKFDERYDNLSKEFEVRDAKNQLEKSELKNQLILQESNNQKKWNIIIIIFAIIILLSLVVYMRNFGLQKKLGVQLKRKNFLLERSQKKAVHLAELKSQFSETISHELRTPLHGIIGLTSLLISKERKHLTKGGQGLLDNLKFSAEYLLKLINDVLEISKIESETITLDIKSFNFKMFTSNLNSTFKKLMVRNNNQFEIILDKRIPEFLKGDSIRMSQVLMNLVGNALKFTKHGKVILDIALVKIENDIYSIRFKVIDNGPGIPKDKHKQVFDKFIQVKNNKFNQNGTGLGLPIVKAILRVYNSEIHLESEPGKGAEFSFDLDFELGTEKEVELSMKQIYLDNRGYENSKILLVDDNEINLIVSEKILEEEGYEVVRAMNGLEALVQFKAIEFDLVLMDLHMPKLGGVETTIEIRKNNLQIPIILISASNVTSSSWEEYRAKGFNDFVTKPYNRYDFLQKVLSSLKKNSVLGDSKVY